jgi:arylsulfatase A-like enzyme
MTRSRLSIAIALTLATVTSAHQPGVPSTTPNVLLIVADDLGYGDLSSYGAPDIKTPHLDRLAHEGVRLTDYYANAPVCTPTRAALMTGRYQQRVLLERPLTNNAAEASTGLDIGLPATGRSLPQLLKNAGYATGLIGKWHLGYKPEYRPARHGFDYFFGYLAGYIDWYTHVRGDGEPDLWENDRPVAVAGYLETEVTRRAIGFINDHARGPFFLEVALGSPHWPFQSPYHPSEAIRRNNSMVQQPADPTPTPPTRADYASIVEEADANIGRILAALEKSGAARNTVVVFISDNGGEWLSRNAPFFHRKDTLWEGGVRVPGILRWPGQLPAGKVSSQVAITMDLTRTILGAAGANVQGARLEGVDLLPLLKGTAPAIDRTLFWRAVYPGRQQRSVRSGRWKMLLDGSSQLLFDITRDPGERNDLAAKHPDVVSKLKTQIEAWEKDVDTEAAALQTAKGQ